jgi:hypothetical protein
MLDRKRYLFYFIGLLFGNMDRKYRFYYRDNKVWVETVRNS